MNLRIRSGAEIQQKHEEDWRIPNTKNVMIKNNTKTKKLIQRNQKYN